MTMYADDVQVTQPKRIRLDPLLLEACVVPVPPPLVSALEEAYSDLYLTIYLLKNDSSTIYVEF